MPLPNAEDAQIPFPKLAGYLLSASHPRGKEKGSREILHAREVVTG